ncbi:NAD(P)-dependent oxidoreductase [Arthrobacter sp. NPDC080031]|uniref:NAD(P)-dependent oxidoreductase n=1 Tax=Arthrobacter sp. NPDC080031 TaxID=3155918 RepID=UPI00344DD56C
MVESIEPDFRGPREPIGFIGLGVMGQPMALNLAKSGTQLVVWNRSLERAEPLRDAGAVVAASVREVFDHTRTVILMLVNEEVTDSVLGRGTQEFADIVAGHLVISMGSAAPEYSRGLASDIHAAGGRYVESPVSGSRKPAEAGQLVALLGGSAETVSEVQPLLAPMCRKTISCGPVGNGLLMKLAVNHYLTSMLAALAEAVHFADRTGLDLTTFQEAIDSGPMACDLVRIKIPKLIAREFEVQAATDDAYASTVLVSDAARAAGIASPILDLSSALYKESVSLGNARLDMVSVLEAIEARSARRVSEKSTAQTPAQITVPAPPALPLSDRT